MGVAPRAPPPVSGPHFSTAQPSEVWHLLCQSLSVCLSVPPSVTLVSYALTVHDIEICFAPHDRGTFVVTGDQILNSGLAAERLR